mmetsp:Transcript_33044/g.96435  ORF Transcript_33044/g.96435 Transcript_33044/m.96435 type:complete len:119 (-) Transcript_33044:248-604(-)
MVVWYSAGQRSARHAGAPQEALRGRARARGDSGGAHCRQYFVTALEPSETACFDSSPGSMSLTAVSISLLDNVLFLFVLSSFTASVAARSKISFMKLFMIFIARLEIEHSRWICFSTL